MWGGGSTYAITNSSGFDVGELWIVPIAFSNLESFGKGDALGANTNDPGSSGFDVISSDAVVDEHWPEKRRGKLR